MPPLDDTDRKILNRIQSDFPITPRPYLSIAEQLGLSEQEIISRQTRLKAHEIIRLIGGNFYPEKLGFVSTLCAAKVPEDKIDHFADIVNRYPGVTHNYLRKHRYNVWFTLIAESEARLAEILEEIREASGVAELLSLPAKEVFKIKVDFRM